MEFPNSGQFEVTHESSFDAAKAFLDNERGEQNENVSSKKSEMKDTISELRENDNIKTGENSLNNSNINGNTIEEKNPENNKQETEPDISVVNSEQEKFTDSTSKIKDKTSNEEHLFRDSKSSKEEFNKDFKKREDAESKEVGTSSLEKDENKNETSKGNKEALNQSQSASDSDSKEEKEEWMDILGSGQLKKKTLKPGIPDSRPQKADVCEISVTGKLEDGTIFEQSKCLEINLGDNETIQGLDFALALMDKGEEAEIIIASRFGYGSLGCTPHVPPDATLYYHVTLLDVKPEPLISTLSISDRIAIGSRKKERGNWWYSRDEHTLAIHSYRRALDYLDDTDIPGEHSDKQMQHLLEERLKTYNNLGASQMKISAYDAALLSIDQVLNCQPKNVKALFRKSKILKEKGELSRSIEVIRQALAIVPDSKGFQQELSLLLAAQRKDNSKQRDLYKKMMGNSSHDNETDKKKKPPYNAFKWIAAFSFAVAVIGAVAFKYRHIGKEIKLV
ncbi:peptidyl-prolyl cis-trans isomerase zonda [Rhodnius prolixus]|uniref:peptidyl-prolyl cis-trans isomerase zonda n=1 Tax=Rhodnius prolixus TaxID=13249 RepID=UPI003D18870B